MVARASYYYLYDKLSAKLGFVLISMQIVQLFILGDSAVANALLHLFVMIKYFSFLLFEHWNTKIILYFLLLQNVCFSFNSNVYCFWIATNLYFHVEVTPFLDVQAADILAKDGISAEVN